MRAIDVKKGIITFFSIILGIVMLTPLIWLVGTALTEPTFNMSFLPTTAFTFDNIKYVWNAIPFGKYYINTLTLALNRKTEAVRNYLSALKNYWTAYYKIRKLTLYDFDKKQPVCIGFDNIIKRHTYK